MCFTEDVLYVRFAFCYRMAENKVPLKAVRLLVENEVPLARLDHVLYNKRKSAIFTKRKIAKEIVEKCISHAQKSFT
ncbi:hypothetical protein X975_00211, partial [Stegodyphus mimosarum]